MRVLFTCVVGSGHFNPMVPLARAFLVAGHAVAVATDPRFCPRVRALGFEAFPAGLDMDVALRRFMRTVDDWRAVAPVDRMRHIVPGIFAGARVEPMLADLARLIETWSPDLLIHDSGEMAGAIAAERVDIAHVEHGFGPIRDADIRRLATDALAPVCERHGVDPRHAHWGGAELLLDICPPGLQGSNVSTVDAVQSLRPMGFDGTDDPTLPPWVTDRGDRRLVYMTMGTVFNDRPAVFRSILDGLVDLGVDVLVTVGRDGEPSAVGPVPEHVRVERFVSQSALLPHVSAFVSHMGSGAMLGGVIAGVPMLGIPQGADQFVNAALVVDDGIGLRLLEAEATPEAIGAATARLIEERGFRDRLDEHRRAIAAMPPPEAVVPVLERYVRDRPDA